MGPMAGEWACKSWLVFGLSIWSIVNLLFHMEVLDRSIGRAVWTSSSESLAFTMIAFSSSSEGSGLGVKSVCNFNEGPILRGVGGRESLTAVMATLTMPSSRIVLEGLMAPSSQSSTNLFLGGR